MYRNRCFVFCFCFVCEITWASEKCNLMPLKHTAGWRCQNTDHVPAAKTRRRVALSAVRPPVGSRMSAWTHRRVALSKYRSCACRQNTPQGGAVGGEAARRLQDVGMSAKWTNFRATGYRAQISSAYARPMLVADCCRHGLLLCIIEDWPRWAFPSAAYYIDMSVTNGSWNGLWGF